MKGTLQVLEQDWLNTTLGKILVLGLPIAVALIWYFIRRRSLLGGAMKNYPYVLAACEIVLALAIGWSFGTIGEIAHGALAPIEAQERPLLILGFAMYLAVSYSLARLVDARAATLLRRGIGAGLSRLSRTFVYGFSLFTGLLVFLAVNDFTRLTVVVGGVAAVIAFGLRQTLTDIVSGVALGLERAFRLRDWIILEDGTAAEVIDIDWRATHLRGWDRTVTLVPNSKLSQQSIRVLPKSGQRYADSLTVLIGPDEDPGLVKSLLEEAVAQCDRVLRRPPPLIRLADASTIPYRYSLWVHFDSYMESFAGRDELYMSIHKHLGAAGIQVTAAVQDIRYGPLP